MNTPSFHDLEQLSAMLDGQLSPAQKTRLEARIKSDPALATALEELHQVRTLLRRTPRRHVPRQFTLTRKMTGIRPPLPFSVPVLSWASAVAMLLFALTFGFNLLGQLSIGSAAPKAANQYGLGNGPAPAATAAPVAPAPTVVPPSNLAPFATQAPMRSVERVTPTVEATSVAVPEATSSGEAHIANPPAVPAPRPKPIIPWLYIWLALAILLIGSALLIRWLSVLAFMRKNKSK